jgi:type II secretory pathway pseudopilin PulG
MKQQRGISLIELVVFIVIVAIMASGALVTFKNVLNNNNSPGADFQAAQLADARMNIIIMSRLVNGFPLASDPCAPNLLAPCVALTNYGTTAGLTAASVVGVASGGLQLVTVTVTPTGTGRGRATNVVEFVQ